MILFEGLLALLGLTLLVQLIGRLGLLLLGLENREAAQQVGRIESPFLVESVLDVLPLEALAKSHVGVTLVLLAGHDLGKGLHFHSLAMLPHLLMHIGMLLLFLLLQVSKPLPLFFGLAKILRGVDDIGGVVRRTFILVDQSIYALVEFKRVQACWTFIWE